MKKIILVTGNKGKLKEIQDILKHEQLEARKIDLPEMQGERHEITIAKVKYACDMIGEPVIVDDVSLCFDALSGLPGPYIKDFLTRLGPEGLVKMLSGFPNKGARAIAMIGYCEPGKEPKIFEGIVEGNIVDPRGDDGFGWDCIFEERDSKKTFAEMSDEQKNKISHRKRALEQLRQFLEG